MSIRPDLSQADESAKESLPGRLVTQLTSLVSARLQLAQIEIEEAQAHVLRRLAWLLALGISSLLALQCVGLFLMLSYDGTTRLWMVFGMAATFLLLAAIAAGTSLRLARDAQPLLAATCHEIANDFEVLRGAHGHR